MKPPWRLKELIDDVDKLSLVEAAVILNAYAHFNCCSPGVNNRQQSHTIFLVPFRCLARQVRQSIG